MTVRFTPTGTGGRDSKTSLNKRNLWIPSCIVPPKQLPCLLPILNDGSYWTHRHQLLAYKSLPSFSSPARLVFSEIGFKNNRWNTRCKKSENFWNFENYLSGGCNSFGGSVLANCFFWYNDHCLTVISWSLEFGKSFSSFGWENIWLVNYHIHFLFDSLSTVSWKFKKTDHYGPSLSGKVWPIKSF